MQIAELSVQRLVLAVVVSLLLAAIGLIAASRESPEHIARTLAKLRSESQVSTSVV